MHGPLNDKFGSAVEQYLPTKNGSSIFLPNSSNHLCDDTVPQSRPAQLRSLPR